jgi:uncharacterized protein YbjT (DUF2867 family)
LKHKTIQSESELKMTTKGKILVVGASGTVGENLVQILRAKGEEVVAATSRKDEANKPGRVYLNVATGEGIHAAFSNVERAFLLSPPGFADQYAMLSPLVQAAKRAGLQKVVLMTAMGANAVETSPFRRAEIELEKSGLTYNIIRPNWFMQNFNTFWVHGLQQARAIELPAGAAPTSFIDARDISAVAAVLLTSDKYNNRDFDLTGSEALTHSQVAQAIGKELSEKVTYTNIEPKVLRDGLVAHGLPADYVDFLILIFGFLREGYSQRLTTAVQDITGKAPRKFAQYAQDNRAAWAK